MLKFVSEFLKNNDFKKTFFLIIIRSVPVFWTFGLLYIVSVLYNENFLTNYEINVRLIGMGISLVSIPFFNSFLFCHYSKRIFKLHHYYIFFLSFVSLIFIFLDSKYTIVSFCILMGYIIRVLVALRSTAKKRNMGFFESIIFYGALVFGYPLLLTTLSNFFYITGIIILVISYGIIINNERSSLKFSNDKRENRVSLNLAFNSLAGLILNNVDVGIASIIKTSNNLIAFTLLLARRFAGFGELISQIFVQSFTLKFFIKNKYLYRSLIIIFNLFIIIFHSLILNIFIDYKFNWLIILFLIVFAIKNLLVFEERLIFESKVFYRYIIYMSITAVISIFGLFIISDTKTLIYFYSLIIASICFFRYTLSKKSIINERYL